MVVVVTTGHYECYFMGHHQLRGVFVSLSCSILNAPSTIFTKYTEYWQLAT